MLRRIRSSFSAKLSIGILVLTAAIFLISLGVLFTQSRHIIRTEAVGRATSVLNTTMLRMTRTLMTIENATNTYSWMIEKSFQPDQLLDLTRRIVFLNPNIDGCSVSAEPDMFPKYGRHFSAYTVRETDTIVTVVEKDYEYFQKIWYKTPRQQDAPCWVAYYDDVDSLDIVLKGMLASYGRPLKGADGRVLGIISTDLSLLRLSKLMKEVKPYPNSYFIMLNEEGHFMMHPDSTCLFTKTIFNVDDPVHQTDVIALGHEMTQGKTGQMVVRIDGSPCLVCYQPVADTKWSLALVCPDSDVLADYYRLTYIVIPLFVVGLLIIVVLCHRAVTHSIKPINLLVDKTQAIAAGDMEVHIPTSQREDVIGRLQNSFATMLQRLNFHMGSVRYTSEQTRLRNEELERATRMVEEADKQKTTFIQNVTHQIRTPLNIIMGFAQVLRDTSADMLSKEELKSITDTMSHNSKLLNRMVLMLFDSSDSGLSEELNAHKQDRVSCNDIALDAVSYVKANYPAVNVNFETDLDDDVCIETNRVYMMRSLRELLYNSAKYSDGTNILLRVMRTDDSVRFVVEDTGKGITEAESESLFHLFAKVDDLSEGLGLGLPLAKRHAMNLGGDLMLDTDYQGGCRFIIELPLQPAPSA